MAVLTDWSYARLHACMHGVQPGRCMPPLDPRSFACGASDHHTSAALLDYRRQGKLPHVFWTHHGLLQSGLAVQGGWLVVLVYPHHCDCYAFLRSSAEILGSGGAVNKGM